MLYVIGFLLAFFVSLCATWITIRLAYRYGFLDYPSRKHGAILHTTPIPRAGGAPVFFAVLVVSVLLFWFYRDHITGTDWVKHLIGIFLSGFCIVLMGLVDDKKDLSPILRLVLMFLFAFMVVGFGIGVSYVTNPFAGGVFHLDTFVIPFYFLGELRTIVVWADLVAVLWIVSLMNIVNWSSGLDGQNAGISTVALLILGFASLRYDRLSEPTALLSFITAGAFLGFLFFSAYPQKIMPGFGGSTFSGFMIAVLSILSGAKFATAAIVLAVPILDACWVFFRRILRKQNPMQSDRTHLHHYLLDLGWSKRKIAYFYWIISAILGILTLGINSQSKVIVFVCVSILFLIGVLWIRRLLLSSKP